MIIISLQYQKLPKKNNESAQKWMGRLQTKVAKCKYREYERPLTGQCISGLNDEGMTDEMLRMVATLGHIEEATSKCILTLACR